MEDIADAPSSEAVPQWSPESSVDTQPALQLLPSMQLMESSMEDTTDAPSSVVEFPESSEAIPLDTQPALPLLPWMPPMVSSTANTSDAPSSVVVPFHDHSFRVLSGDTPPDLQHSHLTLLMELSTVNTSDGKSSVVEHQSFPESSEDTPSEGTPDTLDLPLLRSMPLMESSMEDITDVPSSEAVKWFPESSEGTLDTPPDTQLALQLLLSMPQTVSSTANTSDVPSSVVVNALFPELDTQPEIQHSHSMQLTESSMEDTTDAPSLEAVPHPTDTATPPLPLMPLMESLTEDITDAPSSARAEFPPATDQEPDKLSTISCGVHLDPVQLPIASSAPKARNTFFPSLAH